MNENYKETHPAPPPWKLVDVEQVRDCALEALERIRAILDRPPHALDNQAIKSEIASVLGPYTYQPWPRLK